MALLFWPFMLAAILLSFIAVAMKRPMLLVISFVLIIPLSLYLAATPLFKWWGLAFPLFYLAAAISLKKKMAWLSVLLILPIVLLVGWLGFAVLNQ